ncbi:dihydrodipicolinate synthase family protein [Halobacillus naozhouensis]|uniref:Dihydrodipicolinate synthase family protein n=1 Tax=Halobacillus naozhouensis TaxID=554880 RepID=A0ABY8IWA8_9BACI|nr:dihydrodipicolinate synthase family protein [Halobacillus naozhouensis]WFT74107.1 dihydrodipicolinate synthase family protein [Halobacillus naozhouensis]
MENQHILFKGVFPPVVTLFDQNGEFDWDENQRLTDVLIDQGVHGLLYLGSTGEFSALTKEERKQFAEEMVRHVNGRVPVLVGTGTTSLKETIELSQHAESVGADGVLIVNPYYWKYSEDQLYHYYTTIADHVSTSIMLYNIPQLTGQNLSSDLVCRLAKDHQNIVGIKETVADIGHIRDMILSIKPVRPDFSVFAAFDEHLLPALQIGADGSINGTAVFEPRLSVQLYEAFQKEEYLETIQYHQKLIELMPIYQYSDPLFMAIKEAVHQHVLENETGSRSPCLPSTNELKQRVSKLLKEYTFSN